MNRLTKHLVAGLVLISLLIYMVQFFFFHDIRDTVFYMLQDWAFLPVQVALVSVILARIINDREKRARIEKTRILTSTFYSELGTRLLCDIVPYIVNIDEIRKKFDVDEDWKHEDFKRAASEAENVEMRLHVSADGFIKIRNLLTDKRMTLLVIASNPALLEHEQFTDMLWAVFHLNDELSLRTEQEKLPDRDLEHLNYDTERVLKAAMTNWILHLEFLEKEYPYLYRLEIYRNPFKRD